MQDLTAGQLANLVWALARASYVSPRTNALLAVVCNHATEVVHTFKKIRTLSQTPHSHAQKHFRPSCTELLIIFHCLLQKIVVVMLFSRKCCYFCLPPSKWPSERIRSKSTRPTRLLFDRSFDFWAAMASAFPVHLLFSQTIPMLDSFIWQCQLTSSEALIFECAPNFCT